MDFVEILKRIASKMRGQHVFVIWAKFLPKRVKFMFRPFICGLQS